MEKKLSEQKESREKVVSMKEQLEALAKTLEDKSVSDLYTPSAQAQAAEDARSIRVLLHSPAVDRGPVNTSRDTYAPAEPSGELREKVANILYIETDKYYPGIYGIADRILAAIFDEPKEATHE
jgi:hypothetical protein